MTSPLMDYSSCAERLGTTVRHLQLLVHRRGIPFIKLGDGRNAPVRFDPADVDRWLERRRVAS